MASIAINGLARIGRAALKVLEQADGAGVVAVNDLIPPDNLTYLLRYDTVYGRWHTTVTADGDALSVDGRKIPVLAEHDPASLPWKTLGVDLVLECTGAFRREEDLKKHLSAGARRVILSAPARTETVATVVRGVNQAPPDEQVVSCASCTTNCITPVAEGLDRRFGVRRQRRLRRPDPGPEAAPGAGRSGAAGTDRVRCPTGLRRAPSGV
jgi:glyceraldehyde 3-phosphate dehydrogenase